MCLKCLKKTRKIWKLILTVNASVIAESEKCMRRYPNLKLNPNYSFCRELMSDIMEDGKEHPKLKRLYRDQLKRAAGEDPLRCSLRDGGVRIRRGEEWDSGPTEYRIIKGEWTPEEIMDAIDDAWIHIYSAYDCTAQLFTVDIHAKQTPVGLVWIHRKGFDV